MQRKIYTYVALGILFMDVSASAATLKGTVVYEGPIPKLKPIKMDADPICHAKHEGNVLPETLVLGDGQTMANVFVQVKNPKKGDYKAPEEPAIISQVGCVYSPHVLGVMVNQPVKILNTDGTLHNVHAMSKKNKEFNMAMPKFKKEATKTFDQSEFMFLMKCDVHPWMGAWISVMPHPFFATTEKEGTFTIKDLPPGEYQVEAWHERLGTLTQKVVIEGPDDVKEISYTFQYPSLKKEAAN